MNMSTKTIKISIDDLIDKFKKYNDNEEDIALIRRLMIMLKRNILVKREYLVMTIYYIHLMLL